MSFFFSMLNKYRVIKMKTIKNKVLFLLFGLFLGSISVVAATIIESKDVSYIRSSSNVTNVQEEGSIP